MSQNPNSPDEPADRAGDDKSIWQPPLTGEIVERGTGGDQGWGGGDPFAGRPGIGRSLFGPRSFAGGRVQVYGCSPGCLIVSLSLSVLASVILTLLLNAIF